MPPFLGAGLLQYRVFVCSPPPHDLVQALDTHLDQFPSTGHSWVLHGARILSYRLRSPSSFMQASPPCFGAGESQYRILVCMPPPQDFEQEYDCQLPQLPSIGAKVVGRAVVVVVVRLLVVVVKVVWISFFMQQSSLSPHGQLL